MSCILCGCDDSEHRFSKGGRRFLRCRECGLIWVDPLPTRAELDAYYARSYAEGAYSFFAEADEIRRAISEDRLARLREVDSDGRWLDVGASSGDFVAAASACGIEAEGLELSSEAVEHARERGLVMHCSPVEDFAPEHRYATITAFDVIEHMRNPRHFVQQLASWLEPGGRLVMTLPDVSSLYPRWLMRRHWFYYWPDEHLFYFDPRTIRRLLEEEGLQVQAVGRATKPLTLRYAAANLRNFNASLGRIAGGVVGMLPEGLQRRAIPMYVGEMRVLARRVV